MTERKERWQRVERIAQAALELARPTRSAFLRDSCGDDEDLLREVEDLLAQQSAAARFLEAPVDALA